MRRPPLLRVLAGVAIAFVLVVLLAPQHTDLPITWLHASGLLGDAVAGGTPLWWALEDLSNVALVLPVGLILARRLQPVPAWALAVAGSVLCETAQLWIPSRHASLRDVVMNAAGAAIGVAVVVLRRWLATRRAAQARTTWPHSVQAQ